MKKRQGALVQSCNIRQINLTPETSDQLFPYIEVFCLFQHGVLLVKMERGGLHILPGMEILVMLIPQIPNLTFHLLLKMVFCV